MMKRKKIIRYSIFAIIATIANLLTQRLILSINKNNLFFFFALLFGTLVGLLIKYFLDKKWIFFDNTSGLKSQTLKFSLYTAMGIFTTMIFWGIEILFWLIWQKENMRELGAIIGLFLGYIIKYKLDKKFVFEQR